MICMMLALSNHCNPQQDGDYIHFVLCCVPTPNQIPGT